MNSAKLLLKNNRVIYDIYNRIGSAFLNLMKIFVRTDDKLVLFNSFGGQKFDDSPKVIYDYMRNQKKYNSYKLVWALNQKPKNAPKDLVWVKNNSLSFFMKALKAKYWVTNSSMERGLKFKKKGTIYINTWHGSPLKKMGYDADDIVKKLRVSQPDIFYCQSNHDRDTFARAFRYPKRIMKVVGLPRNDELADVTDEEINKIKEKLHIPKDKKIILYAPTFRDYTTDTKDSCFAPPFDVEKWRHKLSDKYIILFRAHYEISKVINIQYDDFIINVTDYECLNDLMKISDILLTDYSSIMIDYSILERPIVSYGYDLEEYAEKRGLYFDFNKILPNGVCNKEDEAINLIINMDLKEQKKKTIKFRDMFVEKFGSARFYIDEIIKPGED